jgi:hypothetical protein
MDGPARGPFSPLYPRRCGHTNTSKGCQYHLSHLTEASEPLFRREASPCVIFWYNPTSIIITSRADWRPSWTQRMRCSGEQEVDPITDVSKSRILF